MARMHARRRGKSGSTKPSTKENQKWVTFKAKEVEQLVLKLGKQGNSTSKIGMMLRDSYGIADVKDIVGKKILTILKDNKIGSEFPEDLQNLIRRSINVRKHLEVNKKDIVSKRGLQLINSKIRRLEKYYIKEGVLGPSYSRKRAELSIR